MAAKSAAVLECLPLAAAAIKRRREAAAAPDAQQRHVTFEPLAGPQRTAFDSPADILGYGGGAGGGKALSLDTRIPTVDGWTTMAEVEVGDVLLDEHGLPTTVVAVTPVMTGHVVYEVQFDDGTSICADADHEWLTFTYAERVSLSRRTDEVRAARRATRPRRGTGKRPDLVARNQRTVTSLDAPLGTTKTTAEIAATLLARESHVNHAVPVALPLDLPAADLPIPPYTLGAWLGDGTSTSGGFTCDDEEILDAIRADGYAVSERRGRCQYGILGLQAQLRRADLIGNKHIPLIYQRASYDQRLALLQGIIDTDGHVTKRGSTEISLTNERLMRDVWRLLMTLGIRATVTEGRAMLDGRDCGPKYRVKFTTTQPVARLRRKAERLPTSQRSTSKWRYIIGARQVESVPVRCIQVDAPSHLYLASEAMVPTHNSFLTLGLAVTRHRRSIVFRRESEQTRDLWSKLGALCGAQGRSNENLLTYRDLPGDRYVRLAGCKNESDWRKYQGQGHDLYGFDEATEFSELQVRTLIAWNRTEIPGQRCRVVLAFNPPTSAEGQWIVDFFAPWLDPRHPNPAEPGELRWYVVIGDRDVECDGPEPFEHGGKLLTPLSRTFIPARLEDNPYLEQTGYRKTLQNIPEPLRSQMLYGDFTVGQSDHAYQVIPTAWVRAAQERWIPQGRPDDERTGLPIRLSQVGVDIAMGGAARTVIARRYGDWLAPLQSVPGTETPTGEESAELVIAALSEGGGPALIDCDGVGAETYGLVKAHLPKRARAYRGSAPTTWSDDSGQLQFFNTRAAAFWSLRQALSPESGRDVALPPDRAILSELTAVRWQPKSGRIKLEDKAEVLARVGRSPDLADAIVMAFWTDFGAAWDLSKPLTMRVA